MQRDMLCKVITANSTNSSSYVQYTLLWLINYDKFIIIILKKLGNTYFYYIIILTLVLLPGSYADCFFDPHCHSLPPTNLCKPTGVQKSVGIGNQISDMKDVK